MSPFREEIQGMIKKMGEIKEKAGFGVDDEGLSLFFNDALSNLVTVEYILRKEQEASGEGE